MELKTTVKDWGECHGFTGQTAEQERYSGKRVCIWRKRQIW